MVRRGAQAMYKQFHKRAHWGWTGLAGVVACGDRSEQLSGAALPVGVGWPSRTEDVGVSCGDEPGPPPHLLYSRRVFDVHTRHRRGLERFIRERGYHTVE